MQMYRVVSQVNRGNYNNDESYTFFGHEKQSVSLMAIKKIPNLLFPRFFLTIFLYHLVDICNYTLFLLITEQLKT